jgi:metallo-beta-lactamase class B
VPVNDNHRLLRPAPPRAGRLLTFIVFALGAAVMAAQDAFQPDWNTPAPPHRVIANVYYVGTSELAVFVVTTPRGHILVDAAFDQTVPLIKAGMKTLGLRYEDIKLLLNSQAHYDHAAGLARVKRETGARLEVMAEDAPLLEAGGRGDFRFADELTFPPVNVDRLLKDGDRVELGGVTLTARHTPGHTKGATTFTTTVEEAGKQYDVVFATSLSVNAGTKLRSNPKYPAILSDWEKTFRVMKSLQPDVWMSGHAGFFDMAGKAARAGKGPNPYIDPAGYRHYVETAEERFRTLLSAEQQ